MTTLTIKLPDEEAELLILLLKKFKAKITSKSSTQNNVILQTKEEDSREIVIVKNIKPIHFENRTIEKFDAKDKAWISWDGKKAIPVTVTEVTEHNYSIKIEKPLKDKGNEHFLFLDEVRSTPELACINCVTS